MKKCAAKKPVTNVKKPSKAAVTNSKAKAAKKPAATKGAAKAKK